MMMKKLVLLMFVAACGGDGDNGDNANPDANQPPTDAAADATVDAAPATVLTVDCASATIAREVTTSGFAFTPNDITINVGDVVRFAPASSHNVIPGTDPVGTPTDPGLRSGALGAAACLQFTVAGEFNYRCEPHASMRGVVRVEQL